MSRDSANQNMVKQDIVKIASSIAEQARADEQIEAYVSRSTTLDIRAFNGEVEYLVSAASAGVGIRVISGHRQGFAYCGYLDDEAIKKTLSDARDNALFANEDIHASMAYPDEVEAIQMDLLDPAIASTPVSDKTRMVVELEKDARKSDPRIRQVDSADYSDVTGEAAICNSNGVQAYSEGSYCDISVSVIAGDGPDSQTGTGFSVARKFALLDRDAAMNDAVTRAVRLLGATKPTTRECTVVFDPRVTATLISVVGSALSGESVTKGRSFLANRVGEKVMSSALSLIDDPTDSRALSADRYDDEGLASRRNELVRDGVLLGFVYDSTSASRAGVQSTASGVRAGYASGPVAACRALLLSGRETSTFEDVVTRVHDGLYVQSVTGVHSGVNPISGDFSVGIEGIIIRDGALAEPVREATIASTLQKMLLSIAHVADDVQWLPGNAAGQTIAISGMMLSGN